MKCKLGMGKVYLRSGGLVFEVECRMLKRERRSVERRIVEYRMSNVEASNDER